MNFPLPCGASVSQYILCREEKTVTKSDGGVLNKSGRRSGNERRPRYDLEDLISFVVYIVSHGTELFNIYDNIVTVSFAIVIFCKFFVTEL